MSIISLIKSSYIGDIYHDWCRRRFDQLCRKDIKAAVIKRYTQNMGVSPNLDNPQTINEKLQVLKIGQYYENPLITQCVDKYLVKEYIKRLFPDDSLKIAKTFAVYDSIEEFENIDMSSLPQRFVLKCNHGCGYNIICNDKQLLDFVETKEMVHKWMQEDFWTRSAEPQYKEVVKRIMIEENLGSNLEAYKIYCFNGCPKVAYVSSADEAGHKDVYLDYFDMNWNHLEMTLGSHKHYPHTIPKPRNWVKMKEIAVKLSSPFPFVRVDLYEVGDDIYFSELTFLPTGGYMKFTPRELENQWGDWLTL